MELSHPKLQKLVQNPPKTESHAHVPPSGALLTHFGGPPAAGWVSFSVAVAVKEAAVSESDGTWVLSPFSASRRLGEGARDIADKKYES